MSSTEAIKNILKEQISSYKMLLELLQKERRCLLDLDAGGVEELSKAKDTLILKLKLLEEERVRLTMGFLKGEVSLKRLSEITGDSLFLDMRSKLISLLQSIGELNEFNRLLIERSLNYIKNNTNFFSFFGMNSNVGVKGTLISRET